MGDFNENCLLLYECDKISNTAQTINIHGIYQSAVTALNVCHCLDTDYSDNHSFWLDLQKHLLIKESHLAERGIKLKIWTR